MNSDITAEEIEELEEQQLDRCEQLGIEPTDYSGGAHDTIFHLSDMEGIFEALETGVQPNMFPGSRYDHPGYRKKLSRFCGEFLAGCSIAQDKFQIPLLGIWPGKVPGGLYGNLPESGRALLLFTEGAFSFFGKVFRAVAKAYPLAAEGYDAEKAASSDVEQWALLPNYQSAFDDFRTAVLDLIIRQESHDLRREFGLPSENDPPKVVSFEGEVRWEELHQGISAQDFDDQCFRFLFGHEFGHILLSRGALEYVDQIPELVLLRGNARRAYNIEINCDLIGVEYAIKLAQAKEIEPELGYAGIFLFFHIWHFVCRSVWRLQFRDEPGPSDPIYLEHPPTLIREHYALDIMSQIYDEEEQARVLKFRLGLYRMLQSFWSRMFPILDDLRSRGIGDHIEPEVATSLNPHFAKIYRRP
ncbi:hypothetical protein HAP41_0000043215 [Bradyrhizobium barranii subsp. apii]|uniref:Uncharacterized protein n=1 Tax=Bradyrhizobium barranii subsp. apii TaxID=2819348 RepID=A0A8T5V3B4_9BRAD|nr:hypothetical protein [Bradyrhizobium barranii]UPT86958.1 hypothetical protein HAP41_0000043215 [Bradyrhizobium barranii subsp. apii]